ncbi:ribonuclease domain-containing protein [Helicobacter sp. T3_23-1059]
MRFFAYLWRPSKNVGVNVEMQEINYVVLYNENIEQKSFFDNITWQDVAIEIILLHPILKGANAVFKLGKSSLRFFSKTKINQKIAKQYSQKKITIKKSKKAKSKTNNIAEVRLNSLHKDTQEAYYGYKRHKWQGKYPNQDINAKNPSAIRANGTFHNSDKLLPENLTTSKGYKEYDVVNKYDPRRFVRDMDNGDIYYTTDHYKTFVKIIE